jgi:hypothetical protein
MFVRQLDLKSISQSLKDKSADISEKEEQLRGYHEIIESKRNRIEEECWRVADMLQPGSSDQGFNRANFQSIKRFVEQIGVHETLDAAEIALAKGLRYDNKIFAYFCGVCWTRIRQGDGQHGKS